MIMYARDNIDRFYVTRKEGIRGFTSIGDCIDATNHGLEEYTKKSKETKEKATRKGNINKNNLRRNRKTTIKNLENKNKKKTTV